MAYSWGFMSPPHPQLSLPTPHHFTPNGSASPLAARSAARDAVFAGPLQRGARSDHLFSPTGAGRRGSRAVPARGNPGRRETGNHRVPLQPAGFWSDDHSGHLQRPLASGAILQGAEADIEDQNVCGDQRQCGAHAGVDGVDRDAGAEVPAVEIEVLVVVIDAGRTAAAATVLLSRSVGVAGRSFSGPAGPGRGA